MAGVYTSLDWDNLPGGVNSTAPNGVRRGAPAGRGWTGSKAETQGGPGRAGRRSKMYGWKLVTPSRSVPTDNSNGTIPQRFVTLLLEDRAESSAQSFPVQTTMNTLDTSACSCGKPGMRSKRTTFRDGPAGWAWRPGREMRRLGFVGEEECACKNRAAHGS